MGKPECSVHLWDAFRVPEFCTPLSELGVPEDGAAGMCLDHTCLVTRHAYD